MRKIASIILIVTTLVGTLTVAPVSAADTIKIVGNFGGLYVPGVTFTVSGDLVEDGGTIQWYISSNRNDGFTPISGATETTWKAEAWSYANNAISGFKPDYGNKYVKAGITPVAGGTEMFSNVIYIQPALAAPTPQAGVNPADLGFVTGKAAYEITPDVFQTGDNTNFYLLDQDENGNFLIMDDYQSGIGNSIDKTRSMDPSDPNNKLAYWLNNGFLESAQGHGWNETATTGAPIKTATWRGLPTNMVDYVKRDSVWVTEKSTDPSDPQSVYTAAVTIPSYTEITKYASKLKYCVGDFYHTRSIHNSASNMYMLNAYSPDAMHLAGHMGTPAECEGNIRVIFWLDKNYFTNVKIAPAAMGANVKAMLVANFKRSDFGDLYTTAELDAIGFAEDYALLSDIKIMGNFDDTYAPGVTLTACYADGAAVNEERFQIAWYTSESGKDSEFSAIAGATDVTYKITTAEGGKYIKAGITPIFSYETNEDLEFYSQTRYIELPLPATHNIHNVADTRLGLINGAKANAITADVFETGNSSRFYLLEAAEDGSDFLVMDDYYGKGGIGKSTYRTLDMSPSDSSNKLAYWLENGFLDSPRFDSTNISVGVPCNNSKWLGIPKSMVDHIKRDSVWRTEAATDGPTEEYVFRAAVTLPSYTEMVTYGSKIKRERDGLFLTRSPYNAGHMYGVGDWNENTVHLSGSDVATDFGGTIKVVFRLKRSYFTGVRIDPSKMGDNVKKVLATNFARSELSHLYSDTELTAMGFGTEPELSDVSVSGTMKAGYIVKADYTTLVPLKKTEYRWSYSDTPNGEFKDLDEKSNSYRLESNLVGKYLRVGVRIKDEAENMSGWRYYTSPQPVGAKPEIVINPLSLTCADGKVDCSFSIENSGIKTKDMTIIVAKYHTATNRLVDYNVTDIKAITGIRTYQANTFNTTVSDAEHISVMIWDTFTALTPYHKSPIEIPATDESISIVWGEREPLINSFKPENVAFNVKIDLERASAVTKYDVYVGIDGGEKQLLSSLNVAPKSVANQDVNIPHVKNGKREVEIEVREGERIVYHDKENILVTNGYTKQFMDEFTRVGINYQWTNGHTVDTGNNDDLERLEFAGFNAERSDRLWSLFEKAPGAYDFNSYKNNTAFVNRLKEKNIFQNLIVSGGNPRVYPMWEEHVGKDLSRISLTLPEHSYAPVTQEAIYGFVDYMKKVDEAIGTDEIKYEVWSEPDQSFFWQPQPYIYDYLNLLQATATTFASYGEDKHIVGLALAEQGNASETVAKFFELGAYPYLDEISYHVYATNTGIDDNHYYENHAEQAKEIIAAAGGWKRQTQTENGWPTGESTASVSEEFAAESAIKMLTIADAKDISYYLFSLKNMGSDINNVEHNWGILNRDSTPKLSYLALTHRNTMLRGGVYIGELDLGDDEIRAFLYLKEGKPIVQIWDGSKYRDEVEYTFTGEHLSVTDFYGTKLADNTAMVTLNEYPIYLEGLSPKYVGMAAAADLADDRDRFLATYAGKLPQFYLSEASRIYNNAINAATSMIPASIEAAITELNVLGQAIIISYGEKAEIEAVMASRSTWDLREAVETLCAAYMCYYDGEVLTEPLYTADGARHTANTLYRNNNQMMPYSDAILTYAIDTDNKVKKLIASDYSPEKIKGYVAGWSMETKVYSDWFDTFRHFEEVTDYGYLAQVPPSSRNAVVGSNAKVRVNANNRSNVPFTGTIRLYDEDGNQLAASQQITLGVNGYEYIELTFSAQKRGASNERTLSVSYVDNAGNILTRTPFTMTLSQ